MMRDALQENASHASLDAIKTMVENLLAALAPQPAAVAAALPSGATSAELTDRPANDESPFALSGSSLMRSVSSRAVPAAA